MGGVSNTLTRGNGKPAHQQSNLQFRLHCHPAHCTQMCTSPPYCCSSPLDHMSAQRDTHPKGLLLKISLKTYMPVLKKLFDKLGHTKNIKESSIYNFGAIKILKIQILYSLLMSIKTYLDFKSKGFIVLFLQYNHCSVQNRRHVTKYLHERHQTFIMNK